MGSKHATVTIADTTLKYRKLIQIPTALPTSINNANILFNCGVTGIEWNFIVTVSSPILDRLNRTDLLFKHVRWRGVDS